MPDSNRSEYQKRRKRIEDAISLRQPDRVPVTSMVYTFAARFAGITVADYISRPWQVFRAHRTFNREFDPDMNYMPATNMHPVMFALAQPCPVKLPGIDLSPDASWQSLEQKVMEAKDYDLIIDKGFRIFMIELLKRIRPGFFRSGRLARPLNAIRFLHQAGIGLIVSLASVADAARSGYPTFIGGGFEGPFSMFSLARSLPEFARDVYRKPQAVEDAIAKALPDLMRMAAFTAKLTGSPRINVGLHREADFPPRHFERLAMPQIKTIVSYMNRAGIVPVLHCDSNWISHLATFRELPARSAVIELDGTTDISKAKKILGGHLCLKGDVPALLLAHASREKVMDYCRRLIENVGDGGGFVLSSGCEVPVDARPENVAAMRESVEKYGWYK